MNNTQKVDKAKELFYDKEFKEHLGNRQIAFISIIGSQFYGLETQTSDFDFKVFVLPTFNDLYSNHKISTSIKFKGNDIDIKDVRDLEILLEKGSTAYIEAVFSPYKFGMKEYISLMNSKYDKPEIDFLKYFHSLMGMSYQKLKAIQKDYPTQETNEGYKRKQMYGFDTKQLLHIRRLELIAYQAYFKILNKKYPLSTKLFQPNQSRVKELLDIKSNKNGFTKDKAIVFGKHCISEITKLTDILDTAFADEWPLPKENKFFERLKALNKHFALKTVLEEAHK